MPAYKQLTPTKGYTPEMSVFLDNLTLLDNYFKYKLSLTLNTRLTCTHKSLFLKQWRLAKRLE